MRITRTQLEVRQLTDGAFSNGLICGLVFGILATQWYYGL